MAVILVAAIAVVVPGTVAVRVRAVAVRLVVVAGTVAVGRVVAVGPGAAVGGERVAV